MTAVAAVRDSWASLDTAIVVIANAIALAALIIWQTRKIARRNDELRRLLRRNLAMLQRVEDVWRFQHTQGTYVGTLRGLWRVLEEGDARGGLDDELRRAVYRAGDEMFEAFSAQAHAWTADDRIAVLDEPVLFTDNDRPET